MGWHSFWGAFLYHYPTSAHCHAALPAGGDFLAGAAA